MTILCSISSFQNSSVRLDHCTRAVFFLSDPCKPRHFNLFISHYSSGKGYQMPLPADCKVHKLEAILIYNVYLLFIILPVSDKNNQKVLSGSSF